MDQNQPQTAATTFFAWNNTSKGLATLRQFALHADERVQLIYNSFHFSSEISNSCVGFLQLFQQSSGELVS